MKRTLTFYKEESGRWFVDLPEWEGEKDELEMVAGADVMLDIFSQFEDRITLTVSTEPIVNADVLVKNPENPFESGAIYKVTSHFGQPYDYDIWLCDVSVFVFGNHPDFLYICR